jgi:hypothetical protein
MHFGGASAALDRGLRVFPVSMLATMSRLEARPADADALMNDDGDDEAEARRYASTDAALIMDAQQAWARQQERNLARQRIRLQERTGIRFMPPPTEDGSKSSGTGKAAAKARREAAEQALRAAEQAQTSVRFIFPADGVVVQTLFHRKERLSAVFAFVDALLDKQQQSPSAEATAGAESSVVRRSYYLRLPPAQMLRDPRTHAAESSEQSAAADESPMIESVGLIAFVNLHFNLEVASLAATDASADGDATAAAAVLDASVLARMEQAAAASAVDTAP